MSRRALIAVLASAILAAPGVAAAHAGIEETERESRELLARSPNDPQLHLTHARILQIKGDWDGALKEVSVAQGLGADRDDVSATRGAILLAAGRPRSALLEFNSVLARRPDAYGILFERGRTNLARGDTAAAARDFERAIAAMPAPTPEHVMAHRDALLALGRRTDAVAALDRGMARVGRVVSLQLAAVDLEVELGRYDAALGRLDELLAQPNPNPALIARRGEILARAGKPAEARAAYARALALIGAQGDARRLRAFDTLRRRLETAVASLPQGGERP